MTTACLRRLARRGPLAVGLGVIAGVAVVMAVTSALLLGALGTDLLHALLLSALPPLAMVPPLVIVIARLACALENADQRVRALAISDPVTGLHNSRFLYEVGALQVAQARRYSHPLSAVAFRLDGPSCDGGMDGMDNALRSAAARLRLCVRECDIFCRLDDDTFLLLLPETSADQADVMVTRLTEALTAEPVGPRDVALRLPGRFGIAAMTRADLPHLIRRAREAMQEAPAGGVSLAEAEPAVLDA